jgi:hypothetical protein
MNYKITHVKGNHLNSHQKIGIWKNSAKELQLKKSKTKAVNMLYG